MHAPTNESTHNYQQQMNMTFTNYLAPKDAAVLKKLSKTDKYSTQLVEDTKVLCQEGNMFTPKVLQNRAVSWYHHNLQHAAHTSLGHYKQQCIRKV